MDLVLKTPRLVLRPAVPGDLDMTLDLMTDQRVMRYAGGARTIESILDEWPKSLKRGAGGALGLWTVFERASRDRLGRAVLLPLPLGDTTRDWTLLEQHGLPEGEVEIGYLLEPAAWGQGFATEIAVRMVRFAFEETALPEVAAVIHPGNEASAKVLRKAGLHDQGLRRAYGAEVRGFCVTRREWQEQPDKAAK